MRRVDKLISLICISDNLVGSTALKLFVLSDYIEKIKLPNMLCAVNSRPLFRQASLHNLIDSRDS